MLISLVIPIANVCLSPTSWTVWLQGSCHQPAARHHDLCHQVVLNALLRLKKHNKYYREVNIDYTTLNELPEDGHLSNHSGIKSSTCNEEDALENPDEQDYDTESFIPMAAPKLPELDTVKQTIQEKQKKMPPTTVSWPPRADAPVNEFVTEGYMSCAFPTLFPTGADFLAPHERAVTVGNYFKHLMKYDDGRFATHPRFRYFALNSEMRWRALQAGRVYIKQHPKDAHLSLTLSKAGESNLPKKCCTMPAIFVEQSNIGSSRRSAS